MRVINVSIPATFYFTVEVENDATEEQVTAAVIEACPKYPDVKAGDHFDPADFEIVDDDRVDDPDCCEDWCGLAITHDGPCAR